MGEGVKRLSVAAPTPLRRGQRYWKRPVAETFGKCVHPWLSRCEPCATRRWCRCAIEGGASKARGELAGSASNASAWAQPLRWRCGCWDGSDLATLCAHSLKLRRVKLNRKSSFCVRTSCPAWLFKENGPRARIGAHDWTVEDQYEGGRTERDSDNCGV